jgi:hypothetical protein
MSLHLEPSNATEAYKAIIDQLVGETTHSVPEHLIRELGIYSKSDSDAVANQFVQSLTNQQRGWLADMLHRERVGAIHDTLAALTWWLLCREVGLTFRGHPMPFELSGMGLHGDYIGRLDGWDWPSTGDEST